MNTTEWTSLVQEVSNKDSKLKLNKLLTDSQYKGQPTYNSVRTGVRQKQKGTFVELISEDQNEERKLLVELIMGDSSLTDSEKLEALSSDKES